MPTLSIASFCDVVGSASTKHDKQEKKAMLSIDDDLFSIGTLEESDTTCSGDDEGIDKSQMDLVASAAKKSAATGAAKPNDKADESVSTCARSSGIYKHSAQVHDGRQYGALATDDEDNDKVIEIIDETDDLHLDEKYSTSTKEQDDDEDISFDHPYKMYATMGVAPIRFSSK